MAEFGELTEVPQPSLPGGVPSKQQLRSPLQGQIPTAWLRTGGHPERTLLCKVALAPSLGRGRGTRAFSPL